MTDGEARISLCCKSTTNVVWNDIVGSCYQCEECKENPCEVKEITKQNTQTDWQIRFRNEFQYWDLTSEGSIEEVISFIAKERTELLDEIKSNLFMYTHQWPGDDEQRVCENCRDVVKKWTVCDASQQKANYLVADLLKALEKLEKSN